MSACLEQDMRPCAALRQYDGRLYNCEPRFREVVERHLESGQLDLYVISPTPTLGDPPLQSRPLKKAP